MAEDQVFTQAFTTALQTALTEMAGTEATLLNVGTISGTHSLEGVTSILTITKPAEGTLVLSMSSPTASQITARILNGTISTPDDSLIRDCIGEVANILAGQAKTLLYGTHWHFYFSPPWPVLPTKLTFCQALHLKFASDVGELVLLIDFPQ